MTKQPPPTRDELRNAAFGILRGLLLMGIVSEVRHGTAYRVIVTTLLADAALDVLDEEAAATAAEDVIERARRGSA